MKLDSVCLKLYYDETIRSYNGRLDSIINSILELKRNFGFAVELYERKLLNPESVSKVMEEIRAIIPQSRGSIVTSRNSILPLSKTKKLNLDNTPVLIVEEKERPIYVFPCRLGESYFSVEYGVDFIKSNWPELRPLEGENEELITRLIKERPDLLEDGFRLEASEVMLETGKVDVIFKDSRDSLVIVEVEREATDATLGQILRLASGYEGNKMRDGRGRKVRAGIVCYRAKKFIPVAAKRAQVEIWQTLSTSPITFRKL